MNKMLHSSIPWWVLMFDVALFEILNSLHDIKYTIYTNLELFIHKLNTGTQS